MIWYAVEFTSQEHLSVNFPDKEVTSRSLFGSVLVFEKDLNIISRKTRDATVTCDLRYRWSIYQVSGL